MPLYEDAEAELPAQEPARGLFKRTCASSLNSATNARWLSGPWESQGKMPPAWTEGGNCSWGPSGDNFEKANSCSTAKYSGPRQ